VTFSHTRQACYAAYVTQAIVNNLAPLLFIVFQADYGVPYEMLGRLVLLNFVTQLITDLAAVAVVDRVGYRRPLVLAHALVAAGLLLLATLPPLTPSPYLGLALAVVVYGVGGGLLEVLVSPLVEALPGLRERKAAAMSLLHSFYCWGQVFVVLGTTLLLAQVGHTRWRSLPLLWTVVPLANLVVLLRVPMPPTVPVEHRTSLGRLLGTPAFAVFFVLMLCAGAAELTMSQWSSLFAEQALGMPKVWGDLLGPCLFAVLMGLARFGYGIAGERIRLVPALAASGALATACYLVAALAGAPLASLVGCALCGLAVSLLWPGTFSLAAARFPAGGAAMFGLLAVAGDAGGAFGPWLAGLVADLSPAGLRAGMLAGTIFPLGVVLALLARAVAGRRRAKGYTALS
jgi:fucose permease